MSVPPADYEVVMCDKPQKPTELAIKPLCSLIGCYNVAVAQGTDYQGHAMRYCSHKHAVAVREYRLKFVYRQT